MSLLLSFIAFFRLDGTVLISILLFAAVLFSPAFHFANSRYSVSSLTPDTRGPVAHRDIAISMVDEVEPPQLVLLFEPVLAFVLDEKESDEDTKDTTARLRASISDLVFGMLNGRTAMMKVNRLPR